MIEAEQGWKQGDSPEPQGAAPSPGPYFQLTLREAQGPGLAKLIQCTSRAPQSSKPQKLKWEDQYSKKTKHIQKSCPLLSWETHHSACPPSATQK